ncbi:nitroreductase : Nitroreductase OS=Oscillatoriales cyanobacterium JSC-12 GN=OsccyDRAFT_0530 PE=4 SV=1: Nitroreductase [Gemmataceae bacterium]|nr:nitroreductase : Nitroreductase OS=Oscillatoriales cyanobacterium JSC-12 GN=OsccyDRAFT_0530 PE=4 SV=1: Nitroreductase [Gemmataceae bacterium]VTT98229.1 nitroreductase : Nitroreductase OS=Oscillatoriales cyanobacterium JSC-12 GN=OsccyDRAFT_0530 PE=4 SV=1: Nitroreductase [Gemmataceae bacterium]
MPAASPDAVLEQLRWRYATKKFDPARKIAPDLWAKLEQAAVLAPSSYGLQPWRFVVVTDPAVRQRLHPVSWNQPQVVDASHLVVFAAKNPPAAADVDRHIARVAEVRGLPPAGLDPYKQMILGSLSRMTPADAHAWAARQCYIALGVFLSACAMAGVDACPMEGFQPARYDEVLGLAARGYGSVVIAAAGYRHPDDPAAALVKARFAPDEVIERV